MAVEWYFQESHETRGPVSSELFKGLATVGTVVPWTPIRRVSGSDQSPWKRAGEVKGLFSFDPSDQLGGSICGDCGALLTDGQCPICNPAALMPMSESDSALPTPAVTYQVEQRYPNLRKYLALMKRGAMLVRYGIWIVVAALCFYEFKRGISWDLSLSLFGYIFLLLMAEIWYIWTMAFLEFVRVVIDIEENTRSLDMITS